jgi:hypothetical protein
MLIPIGFFGGGAAAGAYEQIATNLVTTATSPVVFSSIPQGYKHLQIRYTARGTLGGASTQLIYSALSRVHWLRGDGSGVTSSSATSPAELTNIPANTQTANVFAAGVIDILNYSNTSTNKTVRNFSGSMGTGTSVRIQLSSGILIDTAAISSISLSTTTGAFAIGSRFSLYGIKG